LERTFTASIGGSIEGFGLEAAMSTEQNELRFGELDTSCRHILRRHAEAFCRGNGMEDPCMNRLLPHVHRSVSDHPVQMIFTRFIPAKRVQVRAWNLAPPL